jgi:putative ABC transport system ATP-binding protein
MTAADTQAGTDLVIARTESVTRTFGGGRTEVRALRGVTLSVSRGELVALRGRSGSGKSTLLSIIGGLDQPTSGRVEVAGQDVTAMDAVGLIPILSAAENVGLPMRLARTDPAVREQRAAALLDLVGLGGRVSLRPYELSGGEQQRVAIARALANEPQLLLADEPTGQLDSDTGGQIMRLLRSIVHAEGITAIVATHDPVLIGLADRVLSIKDGELVT